MDDRLKVYYELKNIGFVMDKDCIKMWSWHLVSREVPFINKGGTTLVTAIAIIARSL